MDADRDRPVRFLLLFLGSLSVFGLAVADQPFFAVKEVRIRQAAAEVVEVIVCFHAVLAVNGICDDAIDLGGVEELPALAPDAVVPAITLCRGDRIAIEQEFIEQFWEPYFLRIDDKKGVLFITALLSDGLHAAGTPAAGPLPGSAQGVHIVGDTLRCVFPLQLRKRSEDVHDGPAHGRGGVEGFLHGDKRDIVLLEDFIHGGKLLHVAADPVELVDHDHIQHIVFDVPHQLLEAGAVRIFTGKAFVLVVNLEGDILVLENDAGVVPAELDLHVDRIAVVTVYGLSRVDSYSEHALSSCTVYWQQGIKMPGTCLYLVAPS